MRFTCEDQSENIQLSELDSKKELAKSFFKNQIQNGTNPNSSARSGKSRKTIDKDLNWNEAYFKTTSFGQVIIVPIIFEESLYIPKGDHSLSLEQLNYAMFYQGEYGYELLWVTSLPDNDFLSHNKGLDRFTGNVLVEDWYGNFIQGFSYTPEGIEKIEDNSNARENGECAVVSIFYCTEVYVGNYCGEIRCEWSHDEVTCPDSSGGGMPPSDNPGDFPPDEGGSGGSGDGNPDEDDFPEVCNGTFNELGECEDQNICELALAVQYPNQAITINNNATKAHAKTKDLFGPYKNGNGYNDCADAFRHTYFHMLNTREVGGNIAREFGEAHECDSDSEKETEMDIFNNEVGITLAQFNPQVPEETLIQAILDKLYNGELKILSNLGPLNKVTPQSQVINSESCEN